MERGVSQIFLHGTLYKEDGEILYYIIPVETMNETALVVQDVSENLEMIEDIALIKRPCDIWKNGIDIIDNF